MAKNILITRQIPDKAIRILKEKGYEVDVNYKDKIPSQKKIVKLLRAKNYDVVVTLLTDRIDASIFSAAPSVKMFANYATGYDNIDIVEAKNRGVFITNAPAELSSEAVAEHTVALMLALATRIVEADDFVRRGKYKGWSPMNFIGTDFLGKTVGLVGAGHIGERVAHYLKGLGLQIIYTDVVKSQKLEEEYGAVYYKSIDDLLPKADFVSLHVPLLDSTKHLINETRLRFMKRSSFIVNTSRGPIIDELALEKILKEGVIRGAGLDVFEFEPKLSSGLMKLKNVILTPHIASASESARDQMAEIVANNVIDFLEGRVPKNLVNI